MTALSYFPVVDDQEQLMDLLSRAAWFLSFCPIDQIYIPIASEELQRVPWRVAPGMDENIGERFAVLRQRVVFVVAKKESDLDTCMTQAHIILRWKKDYVPDFVSANSLDAWEKGKAVWQVDPIAVTMEGSYYIEVGLHLLKNRDVLIQENKAKFEQMARKLGKFRRAYLMATGPSVSRYKLFNYTDALSIVCNSVILDEELMRIVRPQILVFADPVFHFGPSQYAAAFRAKLCESVKKHDFMICIPFKYYAILTETIPEVRDRVIAIPFVKERPFNFNLSGNFEVKTTSNILTLLMTPIAASLADEIGYLGCDGRSLKENNYFWSHNQQTQFNDKMANIRAVHPGFFDIDYNGYYLEHCGTLEAQFQEGEAEGKRFYSLGFSHIPALKERIDVGCRKGRRRKASRVPRALLIDPDAKGWSGHYMAYNEKVRFELGRLGTDVQVVCRKDLSPDILSTRPAYIPVFTVHSWAVGNRTENEAFIQQFEEEMREAIERECVPGVPQEVLLYMYCGSLEHAKVLANLQEQYPFLRINVNLFYLSFRINHDWIQPWQSFVEWLESQGETFVATVPTRGLQRELVQLTGCLLPVAPHPSTAITDETYRGLEAHGHEFPHRNELRVLFPSSPRPEKGYVISVECARLLGNSSGLHSVIRHAPTFSTPKPLTNKLEGMPANTTVIEGELSDKEFIRLFAASDIVVLPYLPEAFAKRTSGLLIDALYHRIPCVVIEGTWLAEVVRRYDCGVIVQEATAPLIDQAVRTIAERYTYYRANAHAGAADYFSNNSWEEFGKFLLGPSSPKQEISLETPPKYPRMFDYNRALLPNRQLAILEEGVTGIEQARTRSGATSGYPGWGMLYHLLLSHLDRERTEVIVETGANWGCTTIVLAQALIDAGCAGHVVTFERDEGNAAKARENLASAGVAERVELHVGDSRALLPKVLGQEHFLRVVCLDASHLYEEALFELETLLPKLADDAIVLFDNTEGIAVEGEDPGLTGALKTILERHGGKLTQLGPLSLFEPGLATRQRQLVC